MGIYRFTRQNQVQFSDDWKLFADLFQHIGTYIYRESAQTVFFDDNAQRILRVEKSMPLTQYQKFLEALTAEPVKGEQNLYFVRSGEEKRCLKLFITPRKDGELGFVEELPRRIAQTEEASPLDEVTGLPKFPAFLHLTQRKLQDCGTMWLAAIHISGVNKVSDLAVSSEDCMASVAEVLGRFSGEQVLLTIKGTQDLYAAFFGMEEQQVRMQLKQMRKAVAACVISDDFGQALPEENAHSLALYAGLAAYPEETNTLRGLISAAEFALFETRHDSQNFIARMTMTVKKTNIRRNSSSILSSTKTA